MVTLCSARTRDLSQPLIRVSMCIEAPLVILDAEPKCDGILKLEPPCESELKVVVAVASTFGTATMSMISIFDCETCQTQHIDQLVLIFTLGPSARATLLSIID